MRTRSVGASLIALAVAACASPQTPAPAVEVAAVQSQKGPPVKQSPYPVSAVTDVADTLHRLTPGLEALAPTIETLREAVIMLSAVVNPLSNIADRIPLPGRRPTRRPTARPVSSQRVIDHDE